MPFNLCYAIAAALLFTLGACTTATVAERTAACQATDWASYGENDGVLGVPAGQRDGRFTDCAELGHPADIAAYQAGRSRGLQTYCTLENGYEVGYSGRRYRNVCPKALEVSFLQGYEQGRRDRPIAFYPSFGFGYGYGRHHHPYFWNRYYFPYYRY